MFILIRTDGKSRSVGGGDGAVEVQLTAGGFTLPDPTTGHAHLISVDAPGPITSTAQITGDTDHTTYTAGDQLMALPASVETFEYQKTGTPITATQPNSQPETVSLVLVPGVVELTRGAQGGYLNAVSQSGNNKDQVNVDDVEWFVGSSGGYDGITQLTDETSAVASMLAAFYGTIGDEMPAVAYIRIISTGQVFELNTTAWQSGDFNGGTQGGFSATATEMTLQSAGSVQGWNLRRVSSGGGDVTPTLIDSSAGAVTETLTASTGAGAISFFTNDNVTNTATLAVQSGETLNGVTDGTFLFSNYASGTQFRADEVSGGWVVSVVGASTQTNLAYGRASLSAATSGPSNTESLVALDTLDIDSGDGVVEVANNGLRIPAGGGLFRVVAGLYSDDLDDHTAGIRVKADGATFITRVANSLSGSTAGVDTISVSQLHRFSGGELITLHAYTSGSEGWEIDQSSYLEIQQQPATEEVLAGMVTPEPLVDDFVELVGDQNFTTAYSDVLTLTLPKAGKYRVYGKVSASFDVGADPNTAHLTLGGSQISGTEITLGFTDVATGNWRGTHSTEKIVTVTGPTAIALQCKGDAGGANLILSSTSGNTSLGYQQLPSSSVVMPDAVPVEDLHQYWFHAGTNTTTANEVTLSSPTSDFDPNSLRDASATDLVIQQDGLYQIDYSSDSNNTAVVDYTIKIDGSNVAFQAGEGTGGDSASTGAATVFWKGQLTAGQVVSFGANTATVQGTTISVTQLAAKTVINTTDAPIPTSFTDHGLWNGVDTRTLGNGVTYGNNTGTVGSGDVLPTGNFDGILKITRIGDWIQHDLTDKGADITAFRQSFDGGTTFTAWVTH